MRRHVERDDVVLLAIELEFGRVVALVAVEDQQPVFAFCTRRCMAVEVLNPIQAYCISSLRATEKNRSLYRTCARVVSGVKELVTPGSHKEP